MKHFILKKKLVLTITQVERLSNILDNAGQVILGVVVFSPIISGFDKSKTFVVVLGIIGMISCWGISILLAKKGKKK